MILQCGEYKLCESIDPIRKVVLNEYDQECQASERNDTGLPAGLQSTFYDEDDANNIRNKVQQQDSTTNRQGNTNGTSGSVR